MGDIRLGGAVVTGAASGLGAAIAWEVSHRGGCVVVADVDGASARRVAEQLNAAGGRAVAVHCDVTVEEDVVRAIEASVVEFGGFEMMFNNAGIAPFGALHDLDVSEWDRVMSVNARGTFLGCKQAVLAMRESGGGAIVNTASALSLSADPILPAYTSSKHAILGLTRAVALAYAADGIRCNCICPGDIDTALQQKFIAAQPDPETVRAQLNGAYPGGRVATPEEVAKAAVFLATQDASFVNGAALSVDGGLTASLY